MEVRRPIRKEVFNLEENETSFAIPANYTDSGKFFAGMLSLRNIIETIVLIVVLGFIELKLIPMEGTVRIVVMVVTILPLSLISLVGIDGESLMQYLARVFTFLFRRRNMVYKPFGGGNEKS